MKNPRVYIILFVLLPVFMVCVSCGTLSAGRIRSGMASIIKEVAANRGAISLLKNKRVGKTGFYYVVDSDGRVVFHPQAALIGTIFKDDWFISQLLLEKKGCLAYQLGNRKHLVFYEPLNGGEILCLSIISDDLGQVPADCSQPELK
ncbi:MAG: hypothetical protein JXA07_05350 [Spirochaetes bacterium]|nr:hypothetical protein [Spirochaetota bacterium]